MTPLYTARATAVGGREGRVTTDDGFIDQQLQLPTGLGGKGGATNPEQLFAAGYAACFEGALRLVARNRGVSISSAKVWLISFAIDASSTSIYYMAQHSAKCPFDHKVGPWLPCSIE